MADYQNNLPFEIRIGSIRVIADTDEKKVKLGRALLTYLKDEMDCPTFQMFADEIDRLEKQVSSKNSGG